jgi:hypothetical protein
MYSKITSHILSILQGIDAIKAVYPYPLAGSSNKSPYVVFIPDTLDNVYQTGSDNKKEYKYRMWVIVNLSNTDEKTAFTTILPNAVDKVLEAFDAQWSHQIENHRAWLIIGSGNWGLSEENKSKQAYAELVITYQVANEI